MFGSKSWVWKLGLTLPRKVSFKLFSENYLHVKNVYFELSNVFLVILSNVGDYLVCVHPWYI